MRNLAILLLCVFCFSCGKKENSIDTTSTETIQDTTQQMEVADKEPVIENNLQTGDTIVMNVKNEKGLYTAEGTLNSATSKVYIKFKNENSANLKAKIILPEGGNIRFNQIIAPDKSSDGPFGMDLEKKLEQKGDYILVIGHSQMAENPYVGKFGVQLEM
ncbi:hypothetical protein [Flavobacterium sp. DG2-3]|uniref:hypothetical protein n=1 Tax=Flavobacterium sp. DG2-3 TaxID=3068317 RepID=UPI00273FC118|nr:hypothetical protein [Flavobacterium sp. DG2-3]MDP5199867.1 hypothetical protein [Flavobacterium sp. DG2-3]